MWPLYEGLQHEQWQHTSFLAAYIHNAFRAENTPVKQPWQINPLTTDDEHEKYGDWEYSDEDPWINGPPNIEAMTLMAVGKNGKS